MSDWIGSGKTFWVILINGLILSLLSPPLKAEAVGPTQFSAEHLDFFESRIRPILVDHCYECHSSESKAVKGGLTLDTRQGLLKGGNTGPAVVPGQAAQSLLIQAIQGKVKNLQMPPESKPALTSEQINHLIEWVNLGLPDPRESNKPLAPSTIEEKASTHWAFQKVRHFDPHTLLLGNGSASGHPIDVLVAHSQAGKGFTQAPPAPERVLVRRLAHDLTGLPPDQEALEKYSEESSNASISRYIDELLASPRFGERWARHWLDVSRYADTRGYLAGDAERRYPYSYTYRDYVIDAYNQDIPFHQFVKEQLAADLLGPDTPPESLAALGYLTLGRRFLNNTHDIIDDRIDVVTRGLMGFTVACARCHDHKYDPIPSADYYSLYGVFASSREPDEYPLLGTLPVPHLHQDYLKEKARRETTLKEYRNESGEKVRKEILERTGDYLLMAQESIRLQDGSRSETEARARKLHPQIVNQWVDFLKNSSSAYAPLFEPWKQFAALSKESFAEKSGELVSSWTQSSSTSPAIEPLLVQALGQKSVQSLEDVAQVYQQLFVPQAVSSSKTTSNRIQEFLSSDQSPSRVSDGLLERLFDVPTIQKVRSLRRQIDNLDAVHPGAPPRAMALEDQKRMVEPVIFIRGNPGNRGASVPRQFLTFFSRNQDSRFRNGSGRLELAERIVDPGNSMTRRVYVNRVWSHLFGAPLVDTPSDFGLRSEKPVQMELLDYLADYFYRQNDSTKSLIKHILLSSTYQQSSSHPQELNYRDLDPDNRYLWKMNRKRLDFEATRDTLLSLSGRLDLKMYGHGDENIDQDPKKRRRSIYTFIDRQNLPNLFRTFDFASPDTSNAGRFTTTVPQQALFLLNHPFVYEQASAILTRFQALTPPQTPIPWVFETVLRRSPNPTELRETEAFLSEFSDSDLGLMALIQSLLVSNEVFFID